MSGSCKNFWWLYGVASRHHLHHRKEAGLNPEPEKDQLRPGQARQHWRGQWPGPRQTTRPETQEGWRCSVHGRGEVQRSHLPQTRTNSLRWCQRQGKHDCSKAAGKGIQCPTGILRLNGLLNPPVHSAEILSQVQQHHLLPPLDADPYYTLVNLALGNKS